jgi:hypothetical protein
MLNKKRRLREDEVSVVSDSLPVINSTYYTMSNPVVQPNNTITADLTALEENNSQAGSLTMSVTFY